MQQIVEYNLKNEIFLDDNEYFFSFFFDRFEYANKLWIDALDKKFKKKFKPINILSAKQNYLFEKENYVVLNQKLKELRKKTKDSNLIFIQESEELNKEFSESTFIKDLCEKLLLKQKKIFLVGYTTSNLNITDKRIIILGPAPQIATKYDNKLEQIKLFEKLDIPRTNIRIYDSLAEIETKEQKPFFLSSSYTSGGFQTKIIAQNEDLKLFYNKLLDMNKKSSFLVADLVKNIRYSPNVTALISNNADIEIISFGDQILNVNVYLGNIYPSQTSDNVKNSIFDITKKVGKHLYDEGFRGLFGLDFIVDSKNKIYTVDLNPRRQGNYLITALMNRNNYNLIKSELNIALSETTPQFIPNNFTKNHVIAHTKLKLQKPFQKVNNIGKINNILTPFTNIGEKYFTTFYNPNCKLDLSTWGYYIISGYNYKEVLEKLKEDSRKMCNKYLLPD